MKERRGLRRYFGKGHTHAEVDALTPDTACIICNWMGRGGIPIEVYEPAQKVIVPEGPEPGRFFFDFDQFAPPVGPDGSQPLAICYRSYMIALYWPTTHTLWASDWVHNRESLPLIEHIATFMHWQITGPEEADSCSKSRPTVTVGSPH